MTRFNKSSGITQNTPKINSELFATHQNKHFCQQLLVMHVRHTSLKISQWNKAEYRVTPGGCIVRKKAAGLPEIFVAAFDTIAGIYWLMELRYARVAYGERRGRRDTVVGS